MINRIKEYFGSEDLFWIGLTSSEIIVSLNRVEKQKGSWIVRNAVSGSLNEYFYRLSKYVWDMGHEQCLDSILTLCTDGGHAELIAGSVDIWEQRKRIADAIVATASEDDCEKAGIMAILYSKLL